MINTKSDLLSAGRLKRATHAVESLGGSELEIIEMDLTTRAELLRLASDNDNAGVGKLIMRRCVPLLADSTDDELNELTPAVFEEVSTLVYRLSGMLGEDDEKKP